MSLPWMLAKSHFSIGESLATPAELVQACQQAGLPALLLSDTMTVSGMPELFSAAKGSGVTPLIGVNLRIVDSLEREKKPKGAKPYYLRALIQDDRGWRATLALLTRAFDPDHFFFVPRLLLAEVIEAYRGGGAALTLGAFSGALGAGKAAEVGEAAGAAGIPLYADLIPLATPVAVRAAKEALLLQDIGIPTLISPPALYADAMAADSLDLMAAIARPGGKWDALSARHPYRGHVVRPAKALVPEAGKLAGLLQSRYGSPPGGTWSDRLREAFRTTQGFPATASFTWEKQAPSLPRMAEDEFAALVAACKAGWTTRFAGPVFGHVPGDLAPYAARLKYELGVIKSLGFSAYFLLVAEIVAWAKGRGICVGPGRGSVGGSLIAYLMGITDVDPIRFGLLFERFINPERQDLPDADLDFASLRREEVVQYIRERFGDAYVAGVVNYNTMQAAGALNDVCRMLGLEAGTAFSKLVPKEHGQSWSLDDALAEVPELSAFAAKHPEVVTHAKNLEGRIRTYGKHAAGVIVAGVPLAERAVIERRNDAQVINWDKTTAESFGLVKMDVLGLSTLDMLDIALRQIRERHGKRLDLLTIPLDDPKTLEAFGCGETVGVFQVEGGVARRMLKEMGRGSPIRFEDIVALNALNRPGPLDAGLADKYIKRRNGLEVVTYPHPAMENALRDTYGVLVYQESLMQISKDLAGFTGAEADTLRKAVGKKDPVLMASMKDKFMEGAVAGGMERGAVEEFWADIMKFSQYSFNLSHSAAYSLISYQCMFLKVNYPAEFWAGVLSMVKEDRRDTILADMTRMGVTLLPPDVNESGVAFQALTDAAVLMPLSAVKGLSERSAGLIVAARAEQGRFASIADFAAKVAGRACNSAQRDKLNKVGAFARIEPGQEPAEHHSRRRDQAELLPGLMREAVVIDRGMELTPTSLVNLTALVEGWKACDRCELAGLCHPKPLIRGPVRAMLVLDGPSYREEAADEMGHGGQADAIAEALAPHGLTLEDCYVTSLVKSPKPEKGKQWSTKTLAECPAWLEEEIRILRPPVIVVLGSLAFRHFLRGAKGGLAEHTGKVLYDRERDLNVLIGMSPGAIFFDPGKQEILNGVMEKMAGLLPAY